MRVYGLLITKDDHEAFGDWCRDQLTFYEHVVCLDGSAGTKTFEQAQQFSSRLTYLHERDFEIPNKGDHGLRRIAHLELVRRFGYGQWIMCCHTDEFCYHDPRKIAAKADGDGFDLVSWFSPHFYPHPSELPDLAERLRRPVHQRFQHYHWSHFGNELPWLEDRLYFAGPQVYWDSHTHGSVRPHGLQRPAPYHPILRHFKVCGVNLSDFETGQPTTLYRGHWQGQPDQYRTGLPYGVSRVEDLFVTQVPKYSCCTRFDGRFHESWNMGEEFRPENGAMRPTESLPVTCVEPHVLPIG